MSSFSINFPKSARSFSVFEEKFIPPGSNEEDTNKQYNNESKISVRIKSAFGFLFSPVGIASQLAYRTACVAFSVLRLIAVSFVFVGAALMGSDQSTLLKKVTFRLLDRTLDLITSPVTLVATSIRHLVAIFDPELALGRPIGKD